MRLFFYTRSVVVNLAFEGVGRLDASRLGLSPVDCDRYRVKERASLRTQLGGGFSSNLKTKDLLTTAWTSDLLAEGVGLEPTRPLLNGLRFSKPLPYQFGATLRTAHLGKPRTIPTVAEIFSQRQICLPRTIIIATV